MPYNLIGEKADIRVTKNTVEVYYHGNRVASHLRLQTLQRNPLVKPEHMPEAHKKYLPYNADDFKLWAMSVGSMTEQAVKSFLESGKAAEQGYKACACLTKLGDRYGKERLEAALASFHSAHSPPIRNISSILKTGRMGKKEPLRKSRPKALTATVSHVAQPTSRKEATAHEPADGRYAHGDENGRHGS